jgi:hypothetical protein
LSPATAGALSLLVAASPVGPAEAVGDVVQWLDDNRDEQAPDLVAGQRSQVGRSGMVGVFVCADDGEEGVGEHGRGDPAGGTWSAYQILRTLSNRTYLGELTFRDITADNCHTPLVDAGTFAEAQRILAERGEDHTHRAANGSDYQLTGLMRCPKCSKAMIGTRAHGKSKIYRYYTCYNRSHYDSTKCNGHRLNADAVETAIQESLASFYRRHHALIGDARRRSLTPAPCRARHPAG